MKLFIVESPAKARTIKGYLGSDYVVEASCGHVRELPADGLNVDIEHGFVPMYAVRQDKRDVVAKITRLAVQSDEVIIATDPDREGEAIASHIYDLLDEESRQKSKRVVYQEITKKAIMAALARPREIDQHLVDAAKARQVLDRLIGYKVSPVLWSSVGKGTSAGRVQSVALKIICERQREIEAFKPVVFWYVDVLLGCKNGDFWARVVVPQGKDNRFSDKKVASDTLAKLKHAKFLIANIARTNKSVNPFPPLDTNSMQKAASVVLKWDVTKTMKVAQSLYERGFCTYIRTDSFNISDDAIAAVRTHISSKHGERYLPSRPNVYTKKKAAAAQEAHECIRPTHVEDDASSLTGDERKLHDLIRNAFIASQMSPMVIDTVKYLVDADCGEKLLSSGQTISFDGFTKVWKHKSTKDELLPLAVQGEVLSYKDSKQTENKTKPPDRYTDASLADKLEKDGVGRPATRAPIIKALEDKGYVTKEKSILAPTPMGYAIVDFLSPVFQESFMDIKFTAAMEDDMIKIADGDASFEPIVSKFYEALKVDISKTGGEKKPSVKVGVKCSVCKEGDIVERNGKFGKFFSCNGYPDCKTIFVKNGEQFAVQEKKEAVKTDKKCPKCGKPMMHRKSEYGSFLGCSGFPACKYKESIKA